MQNFVMYNPTKLFFGRNVINKLKDLTASLGKRALLIYGGGSIKENSCYNDVINQLKESNIFYVEYSGIKSNPIIDDVDNAANVGRINNVDFIIAIGGGSVIDTAKMVSIAIPINSSAWNFFENKIKPQKSLPLVAVLTLAATGTEMNPFAVIQNNVTKQKSGYGNSLIYPKFSFLDPQYTITVPANHTAFGIVDLVSHALEAYFGDGDASLSDRFVFSVIKEAIEYGGQLMRDLNNYNLRSKIMYAATVALNGNLSYGRVSGDWGVHSIGHTLSMYNNMSHGQSLSIAYPAWLKLYNKIVNDKIILLGKEVWKVKSVDETIECLETFFLSLGCSTNLGNQKLTKTEKNKIGALMKINKIGGNMIKISEKDYDSLINLMM